MPTETENDQDVDWKTHWRVVQFLGVTEEHAQPMLIEVNASPLSNIRGGEVQHDSRHRDVQEDDTSADVTFSLSGFLKSKTKDEIMTLYFRLWNSIWRLAVKLYFDHVTVLCNSSCNCLQLYLCLKHQVAVGLLQTSCMNVASSYQIFWCMFDDALWTRSLLFWWWNHVLGFFRSQDLEQKWLWRVCLLFQGFYIFNSKKPHL